MLIDNIKQPFTEQVDFFKQKVNLPTEAWNDLWQQQHDRAFVVAGAMQADMLNDMRKAVSSAISDGTTLEQFRKGFDKTVAKHGWSHTGTRDWRTKIIYKTNMATSYASGRLAQLRNPELQKLKPYWRYNHADSVTFPRPKHVSWDGLTLVADHNWFKVHYPPNGWGCHCYVTAVSQADYDASKKTDVPDDGFDDKGNPSGVDNEWAYMPGDAWVSHAMSGGKKWPPQLGAQFFDVQRERMQPYIQKHYADWIETVLADDYQRGRNITIGMMGGVELATLIDAGIVVERTDISLGDRLVLGKKARRHENQGDALTKDDWRNLVSELWNPIAVIFDRERHDVLYVFDVNGNDSAKIVVRPNFTTGKQRRNSVRTAFKMDTQVFVADKNKYEVIAGSL